jgi:predicted transcriptional regulator
LPRRTLYDIAIIYQWEATMRALVDINEAQIEALDALAKRTDRSRASLIRAAIADFLDRHRQREVDDGFGLWGRGEVDGVAYQESARAEW